MSTTYLDKEMSLTLVDGYIRSCEKILNKKIIPNTINPICFIFYYNPIVYEYNPKLVEVNKETNVITRKLQYGNSNSCFIGHWMNKHQIHRIDVQLINVKICVGIGIAPEEDIDTDHTIQFTKNAYSYYTNNVLIGNDKHTNAIDTCSNGDIVSLIYNPLKTSLKIMKNYKQIATFTIVRNTRYKWAISVYASKADSVSIINVTSV